MGSGAGAAGASSAYYLKRFADEAGIPIDITVLEQNSYVGGRSTTICAFEEDARDLRWNTSASHPCIPIELGASIFVSVNHILLEATNALNLSTNSTSSQTQNEDDEEQSLGVFNGQRFVFIQSMGEGKLNYWWNTVKILWKYGISPFRSMKLMRSTVDSFLQMYDEPIFPWNEGLSEAAAAAGLLNATSSTGKQYLNANGIADGFAKDIIQASTRVNYAQNLEYIHGLETMVCMATDGAMSVAGGNWQIFDGMLNASGADIYLDSKVDEIEIGDPNGKLRFSSNTFSTTDYGLDALVLAAPYHQASIKFTPSPAHIPDDIPYVELHVTLFSSPRKLDPGAFCLPESSKVPEIILTTTSSLEDNDPMDAGPAGFFSISRLRSARNMYTTPPRKEYIYKIFSPEPVTAAFLLKVLGMDRDTSVTHRNMDELRDVDIADDVPWLYRKVWKSYPRLFPRVTFEPQQLDKNLWYTSGIESFISTMETSALAGKNVARLIVDGWKEEAVKPI